LSDLAEPLNSPPISKSKPLNISGLPTNYDPYITTPDAAAFLGLKAVTLETWRKDGRGPAYVNLAEPGRWPVIRYRRSDLVSFAERYRTPEGIMPKRRRGCVTGWKKRLKQQVTELSEPA
jgi:Helix-turn-helix domain